MRMMLVVYELFGTYSTNFSKGVVQFLAGYAYQQDDFERRFVSVNNIDNNDLDLSNFNFDADLSQNLLNHGFTEASRIITPTNKNIAFFGRMNLNLTDAIFVNASFRNEPSAILGANNKRRWFPALGVGTDLSKYWEAANLDFFKVRLSYGMTGTFRNYSLPRIRRIINDGQTGSVITQLSGNNIDLQDEKKRYFY